MESFFFWMSAIVSVFGALGVLFVRRPTRALLSLLLTMLCLTVLYTLLHAYFVAIVQLIVYAGAVLVLFLFVIMLQGLGATTLPINQRFGNFYLALTVVAGATFTSLLVFIFAKAHLPALQNTPGTVEALGQNLFSNYLLPFEMISILVLLGIFAAVSLAQQEKAAA